jgi:hypothetical protein
MRGDCVNGRLGVCRLSCRFSSCLAVFTWNCQSLRLSCGIAGNLAIHSEFAIVKTTIVLNSLRRQRFVDIYIRSLYSLTFLPTCSNDSTALAS